MNARIENSVIGVRSQIRDGVSILNSVLMGDDYYDNPGHKEYRKSEVFFGIDHNCNIEGAIIDKNTCIGPDVVIKPFAPGTDLDSDDYIVRDGIVVIPKNTIIQPGTYIGPD
jgi:glucose-1-phosphate adenylyltransferase